MALVPVRPASASAWAASATGSPVACGLADLAVLADLADLAAFAGEYGATIERTYKAALNGYAVELSRAEAEKFAA
ncbi:protease inhibitor I9 family protein, partial [Streptomyces albidoflavus]|uniref:protease inhibitor I9 family protein n=1 Tax=Streptomyces albidoflavus TaxID=1886 RepID=UPI0038D1F64B